MEMQNFLTMAMQECRTQSYFNLVLYNCKVQFLCMPASGDTVFKDPVCKMTVDEKMVQFISEIRGRKVHLCSAICKDKFDTNPKKYGY